MQNEQTPYPLTDNKKAAGYGKKMIVWFAVFVCIVVLAGGAVWLLRDRSTGASGEPRASSQEVEQILASVSKHIKLPAGDEVPIVATVQDAEALKKEQLFYADVKNGDSVIVYSKALRAIVYRPSEDLLVNVGPVYLDENATTTQTTEHDGQPTGFKVEIRNGSTKTDAAKILSSQLMESNIYEVTRTGNAARFNYPKTIVVNLTGKDVSELQSKFRMEALTALPEGEVATDADVLVIIGNE